MHKEHSEPIYINRYMVLVHFQLMSYIICRLYFRVEIAEKYVSLLSNLFFKIVILRFMVILKQFIYNCSDDRNNTKPLTHCRVDYFKTGISY
jgi:hypothetical protein